MRSSCYFLNIGSGIFCMFSKRLVNIWTFDKKDPYGKYSNCTSHYYRRRIHYFSLNSLYFFFLRFSHFHSRSLLYHRTIICRKVTKTPQYFQTAQNIYPLQYRRQYRSGRPPPKHRKRRTLQADGLAAFRLFLTGEGLLLDRLELVFADTAQRAHPIFGNILERRSCGNTSVRITHGRIVNPFADRATILFHTLILLNSICFEQM